MFNTMKSGNREELKKKRLRVLFYLLLAIGIGSIITGYIVENLGLIFGGMIFSGLAVNGIYANRKR